MSTISSHILNTGTGRPAAGVRVTLSQWNPTDDSLQQLAQAETNDDGRITAWNPPVDSIHPGVYEMTFQTGQYFASSGESTFYPIVQIRFEVNEADAHYHVPLLLNRFGYSTYRGS